MITAHSSYYIPYPGGIKLPYSPQRTHMRPTPVYMAYVHRYRAILSPVVNFCFFCIYFLYINMFIYTMLVSNLQRRPPLFLIVTYKMVMDDPGKK